MTTCCPSGILSFRRSLIAICAASALGAAAFVKHDAAPAAPERAALDPGLIFPSGTLVTLWFDGAPIAEHGKDLGISKIWNEPEVQDFFKDAVDLVAEQRETVVKSVLGPIGLTAEDVEAAGKTRIAIAVTHAKLPEDGAEMPDVGVMMAIEMRGAKKAVDAGLQALEKSMSPGGESVFKDVTIGGVPARLIPLPPGMPIEGITYVMHEGWLFAATHPAELEATLARAKSGDPKGSLGSDPAYAAGVKHVVRPKTTLAMFMNHGAILNLVASVLPMMTDAMESSGMDPAGTVSVGLDLDGTTMRERFFAPNAAGAAVAKLYKPMDPAGVLARIPKRSIAAWSASINLKETYDYTLAALKKNPMIGDEIDEVIEEVDRFLGPSWKEDLLPNLGPEIAAFVGMQKFGIMPEIGFLVKIGDRAKVEAAIDRVLSKAKAKGAVRSQKFLEATINTVDLGDLEIDRELNLRPAYVFVDDYLLVTPAAHMAKSLLIAMGNKDGGLLAREEFSKAFGRLKAESPTAGNQGIMFVDLPWIAGFALDSAMPIVQSAVSPRDLKKIKAKVDLAKIPSTEAIVKHLAPILMQSELRDGGAYSEISSPMGLMGLGAAAGAAGAFLAARDVEARAAAATGEQDERDARRRVRPERVAPQSRPAKDEDEDR